MIIHILNEISNLYGTMCSVDDTTQYRTHKFNVASAIHKGLNLCPQCLASYFAQLDQLVTPSDAGYLWFTDSEGKWKADLT